MGATCVHFIVFGKVRVENPLMTDRKVLYLKPPSWIGDICLFVDTLRKATVTAVVTTETLMLQKDTVQKVCDCYPAIREKFEVFRARVLQNMTSSLMCPLCHDIGHSVARCPRQMRIVELRCSS